MGRASVEIKVGERYGRLTVIAQAERSADNRVRFLCRCDCGNERVVIAKHLKSGNTKSCGCYKHDQGVMANTTHNMRKTRLYRIWAAVKYRCTNPNSHGWYKYGARGITICDEWLKFEPFRDWALANGYRDDLTIDRIDVNGNYEPSNCRWATNYTQSNNRRNNVYITHEGVTHTLKEWADITGVNYYTMHNRYKAGKPASEILAPCQKSR